MFSNYSKNFLIYYNNLSIYYVICVLMSIAAIILSWVYHFKNVPSEYEDSAKVSQEKISKQNLETNKTDDAEFRQIINSFKELKKQSIDNYAATLTQDQLHEEKMAEQEQLNAIWDLLKEQEDKFQVGSKEELEGQLKLYR